MNTPTPPLGCGPEGSVSKYADLLNDLEDMAGSYAYAVRREVLRGAGRTICQLERDLAAAQEALQDCAAGLLYIRQMHGELYGVAFDRALSKADAAYPEWRSKE